MLKIVVRRRCIGIGLERLALRAEDASCFVQLLHRKLKERVTFAAGNYSA
jgi:hypothetical protein